MGVTTQTDGALPSARGPLSARVFDGWMAGRCPPAREWEGLVDAVTPVVTDDDAQLVLHCLYELSYRGYRGVDEAIEVDPSTFALRRALETRFEQELRDLVGEMPSDAAAYLEAMSTTSGGPSLSQFMAERGTLAHLREFMIHRSAYQLKEADPHSWGLPRLGGRAKAAFVTIQTDEYGTGVAGQSHAELFGSTMREVGLFDSYGHYVSELPGLTLATGNLISLLGMQHRLLPALLGHLALFEMTSVGPMRRYAEAMRRLGIPAAGRRFYDVHVTADAVHSDLALRELVGGFLVDHPQLAHEVCFGAAALAQVESTLAGHLLLAWAEGRSSLLVSRHPRLPVADRAA